MEQLFPLAAEYGFFAIVITALIWIIYDVLKKTHEREKQYIEIIVAMSPALAVIAEVQGTMSGKLDQILAAHKTKTS